MARLSKNKTEIVLGQPEKTDDTPSMDANGLIGRRVNQLQLAALLGYNRGTIASWHERGCPYVMSGDKRLYDVADVVKWLRESDVKSALAKYQTSDGQATEAESKRLKGNAAAQIEQMEAARMARLLIPVEYVLAQMTKDYGEIKSTLLKIPDQIALNVNSSVAEKVREIADEQVREALASLMIEMTDKPLPFEG